MQCGIAADDVPRILRRLGPQRHAKSDVALDFTERGQIQALTAEGEEDVTAAALLPDVDDQVDPLGMVVKQLEILVDDDQQDGHRFEIASGKPHLLVLVGVPGAGVLEKGVAAGHFAVDGLAHPFGEMTVVLAEVGQRTRDVRQPFEVLGRRFELHIDEDDDERLGGVRQRDAVAQRQEVLGLARTRRSDHHGVKAVSAEVLRAQYHILQFAARFDAHRHHRPPGVTTAPAVRPQPVHVQSPGIGDSQRPQQLSALAVGRGKLAGRHR